jgi:hypothetical protein
VDHAHFGFFNHSSAFDLNLRIAAVPVANQNSSRLIVVDPLNACPIRVRFLRSVAKADVKVIDELKRIDAAARVTRLFAPALQPLSDTHVIQWHAAIFARTQRPACFASGMC